MAQKLHCYIIFSQIVFSDPVIVIMKESMFMKQLEMETIKILQRERTTEEAIAEKMKSLSPKLFGIFAPVVYELISWKTVLIPYYLLTYEYSMREGFSKKRFMNRSGEITVIFDANEVHGFHFDKAEYADFKTVCVNRKSLLGEYEIIEMNCTEEDIEENCLDLIRYRYLQKISRGGSEIIFMEKEKFYRPAVEMTVMARGKVMERYAYLDKYTLSSEHISGLKVRLDS